jgi:hypothetical protein
MFRPMFAVLVIAMTASGTQVVITGGPYAGTYAPADAASCLLDSHRNAMTMAYLKGGDDAGPKTLTEAAINVYDMEAATPGKSGEAGVIFGPIKLTGDQKTTYDIVVGSKTTKGAIALTKKGSGYAAVFDGKTEQGISLHIALECSTVAKF